jgi:hypothetical protein
MATTAPLSTEECEVLAAIADPTAEVPDRSTSVLAQRVDRSQREALRILEALRRRRPALVEIDVDDALGIQFWLPTDAGREACARNC